MASCSLMVKWLLTRELAPPTVYRDDPAPNSRITVVDGNKRSFACSFANFLEIWLKFALHLDGNLPTVA